MIKVVDRVPTQAGRYKMTLPDGSTQYVTMERADVPSVAGTPLNKALFDSIQTDLDGKASTTHNHDSSYAAKSHTHDDRYYTETEMNTKLSGKSNTSHNHDAKYLSLSGGTMTGDIKMPLNGMISWEHSGKDGRIYCASSQQMFLGASKDGKYFIHLGVRDNKYWTLDPDTNEVMQLGSPSHLWEQVYAKNSSISSSDRNKKKDIEPIDERLKGFFRKLKPVSFQFINGTSGRTHTGFIAQDVEEAMNEAGLTAQDFAGFCKDQKMEQVQKVELVDVPNSETGEIEQVENTYTEDQPVEGEYVYGLRYEEFIALNTAMIQELMDRVKTLEAAVLALQAKK